MCCALLLSRVQLFATPWTEACQPLLSMGILQARIVEWVAMPFSRGSSQFRDQTQLSTLQADSLLTEPPGKLNLDYGPLQTEKVAQVWSEIVALCYVNKI